MPVPTTPAEGGSSPQTPTAGEPEDRTFTQEQVDRVVEQRLARERSKFADYADLKAAAERLEKIEADGQSETEKAVRRAEAAERRAEQAEAKHLRLEIAIEKGLTPAQAKRLVGSSREELEGDAAELLEAFGPRKADGEGDPKDPKAEGDPKPDPRRRPTERLRSGAVPEAEPEKSPTEIADEVLKSNQF